MKRETKIIVLQPTRGIIITEAQDALDLEIATNRQPSIIVRTHDLALPMSRNFLVETALKEDWWTHALLLDDDVILPKGGLKELINLNADVAVMDYPLHGTVGGQYPGTIVRNKDRSIQYAGLGATLVKREVFEKMEAPYFVLTQYRVRRADNGDIGFFAGQSNSDQNVSAGEDTHFFIMCHKYNFKIKETKKIASHCRLDRIITTLHNTRYSSQHVITKNNKVERELV